MKLTHRKGKWGSVEIAAKICAVIIILVGVFIAGDNYGNGNLALFRANPSGLPARLDYTSINQEYQVLRSNYYQKLTETQILNGIKHGIAEATNDPYTEYFTSTQAQVFNNQLNSNISGIGAEIGQDKSGAIEVIAPISGSPAANAGIKSGDLITSINGKSTVGMTVGTAVTRIRGKAGTTVKLGVLDNNLASTKSIVRQKITIPSVNTQILPGNIGYMQISIFSKDTSDLVNTDAKQFASDKVKGIILDLRDNPGGLLSAAVNVSSLWLPSDNLILQEKTGNTVVATYYSNGDDILNNIPTVILINGGSASASEITTGALHDNHQAYVIGTKSYGKGVVQQLINLSGGAQLKVTIASWFRPNGENINKKGIQPDETVQLNANASTPDNDAQLNAALNYLSQH